MAVITVTATEFIPDESGQFFDGVAGVAIAIGDLCYLDTLTNKIRKAISSSVAAAEFLGISCSACSAENQRVRLQVTGSPVIGSTAALAVGVGLVVSTTAGKGAAYGDAAGIATGVVPCFVGWGYTGAKLRLGLKSRVVAA